MYVGIAGLSLSEQGYLGQRFLPGFDLFQFFIDEIELAIDRFYFVLLHLCVCLCACMCVGVCGCVCVCWNENQKVCVLCVGVSCVFEIKNKAKQRVFLPQECSVLTIGICI